MKIFLICSTILLIFVLNAQSFKLIDEKYSEDHMFDNNDKKEVTYLETSNLQSIGQVGGIDVDSDGNLIVFHRGSRHWAFDSFIGHDFNKDKYGPIKEKVLSVVDIDRSKVIESWGDHSFYMPHGLTIDREGNIWLTDVALHQVFKFDFRKSEEPELVLGVAFEYGNDKTHLCKPTDVAVAKNGDVFVSDGYCNQRVVQYDNQGNYVREFTDETNPLQVVHSVTLIEELNLVCTVSRQQGRIVCFDVESGKKKHEIVDSSMSTVYAIKYDPENKVLHAVTGENANKEAVGLTFNANQNKFGELLQKWNADDRDLKEAHDLAVSRDGSLIFVGQLNGELDKFAYQ